MPVATTSKPRSVLRGRCTPGAFVVNLLLLVCTPAHGWGALGHEVAGRVAAEFLDPRAQQRVGDLLGDESLAEASTWADRMRSDPAPFWQEQAGPYHYVTVPPGKRYPDVGAPPRGDAVTALTRFRQDLCDPATPRPQRQLALRFALHVIQDLHQPLHVGNGSDRGGNDVELRTRDGVETFHWVWDGIIPASEGFDRDRFLSKLRQAGLLRPPSAGDADPMLWIDESIALRDRIYPPPEHVTDDFLARWFPVAQRRIAEAGLRSAAWLNESFRACAGDVRRETAR